MSDEFDLLSFAHEVYRTTSQVTRAKLAQAILDKLDPADKDTALKQAMPLVAHYVMNQSRSPLASLTDQTGDNAHEFAGGQGGSVRRNANSSRSRKAQKSREHWRTKLEQRFAWGPNHEDVALGDFTIEILTNFQKFSYKNRDAHARNGDAAGAWIADMRKYKVTRLRELPEDVLRARLDKDMPGRP